MGRGGVHVQGTPAYFDFDSHGGAAGGDFIRSSDSDSDWLPITASKHICVLFTKDDDPYQNPNIDVFNIAAATIQSTYNTSLSLVVRNVLNNDWGLHEHDCSIAGGDCLVCYEKALIDRTCLMTPTAATPLRHPVTFTGNVSDMVAVERFILVETEAFMQKVFRDHALPPEVLYTLPPTGHPQAQCASVDAKSMDFDTFLNDYWLPQKPVVIRNVKNFSDVNMLRILSQYRGVKVGAKLSPDVEFEGVDSLLRWGMAGEQDVPKQVLRQLQSPGMVVVRAVR
jgi:hypothetical protein